MSTIGIIFWIAIALVFYTYLGYGIVLYALVHIKRIFKGKRKEYIAGQFQPEVSLVVPCYNEKDIVLDKVKNCLELDYPKDKLKIYFITDGSTDGTNTVINSAYPDIKVLHQAARLGKSAAENRSMDIIDTPFVIFSDANTMLPPHTVNELMKHYLDPQVGAVSGEKRVLTKNKDNASAAGEGLYWKYESKLKSMDSELLTIVGAAGELFSFRKELFTPLEQDTILDDFVLSMRIAEKGYRVVYEPNAYAMETPSENVKEELKRKVRICAGGWQSMIRLSGAFNFMKHPLLSFLYVSHRVLRWSVTPIMMFMLFPLNLALIGEAWYYNYLFYGQAVFYMSAMVGWYLENQRIRNKLLFVPYYFFIMNYAVLAGFLKFARGKQAAAWERSKRGVAVS